MNRTLTLVSPLVVPLLLAVALLTSAAAIQASPASVTVGPPYITAAYVQWVISNALAYIPLKDGTKLGPFSGALCEGRGSSIAISTGKWRGQGYRYFLCVMKEASQGLLWKSAIHTANVPGQFVFGRLYRLTR
jgi:hypothetical protein